MRGWIALLLGACGDATPGGLVERAETGHPADTGAVETGAVETGAVDTGTAPEPAEAIADVDTRLSDDIGSLLYVSWEQGISGLSHVEYSFDEGEWLQTPTEHREPGPQEALLLGIPYESEVSLSVVVEAEGTPHRSSLVLSASGALPARLPIPTLISSDPSRWEAQGRYLMGSISQDSVGWSSGTRWMFILDRQARLVWAMETPEEHWTLSMRRSVDGTAILWDEATWWSDWDDGAGSQVHRMKIDGSITESIPTPGLHHAFTELSDGTLVWGASQLRDGTPTEELVQRTPGGPVETLWRCEGWLGEDAYCQSNSLYWHEPTDSFLYSFYDNSTIIELDRAQGTILRQLGQALLASLEAV